MKKVFRRTLFVEDCIREDIVNEEFYINALNTWAKWCDGMEVIDGYITNYIIYDAWCEILVG